MSEIKTLDSLLQEAARIREELKEVQARYDQVQQAVLEERLRDLPRFAVGDIILVPRLLFGRRKMWPARIARVSLHYSSGHWSETYATDPGGKWENKYISYSVFLQQKDGEFGGVSEGFYHKDVAAYPCIHEAVSA